MAGFARSTAKAIQFETRNSNERGRARGWRPCEALRGAQTGFALRRNVDRFGDECRNELRGRFKRVSGNSAGAKRTGCSGLVVLGSAGMICSVF